MCSRERTGDRDGLDPCIPFSDLRSGRGGPTPVAHRASQRAGLDIAAPPLCPSGGRGRLAVDVRPAHAVTSPAAETERAPWEVQIRRGMPSQRGEIVTYRVPRAPKQTVLDVVTYVQRHLDATLAYRFACRVGMCGSCAMTVNGIPRWTCRTHAARVATGDRLRLEPLRNLPLVKDLVVDMSVFFEKWQRAGGVFRPSPAERSERSERRRPTPSSRARRGTDAGIECIACGVCYAACDVVGWRPDYLGPAALNRAWTLVNDFRDARRGERLAAVSGEDGCHCCHTLESCTRHCPVGISPTAAIAGLKRRSTLALLRTAAGRDE